MAQVIYSKEGNNYYADFDNRKKVLWKERWINQDLKAKKGQIITMNIDGTNKQYRVLKVLDENVVEVIGIQDLTTMGFGSDVTYENSRLDTYLNATYYNTLIDIAKAAIIDKTFKQDTWSLNGTGNPHYRGASSGTGYTVALRNSYGNEITRHIYALSVQDVIDYLEVTTNMTYQDTTLNPTNILKAFWNTDIGEEDKAFWLNSKEPSFSTTITTVKRTGEISANTSSYLYQVKAAFQIDLSKIKWK